MCSKSYRLQWCSGSRFEIAVAAIIGSKARARDLRPGSYVDVTTRPKARAAAASKGIWSKSASTCCNRTFPTPCSAA